MVKSKKKKNIKKEDDKKDIKEALDNEKNHYETLSEDEKETKEKDLNNEQKDEELKENKEIIAYMTKKNFSQRKKKKKNDKRKTDINTQWTEIKQKKDLLVRTMEQIDMKKIKYYAREIEKLCAKRGIIMKKISENYHKKTKGKKKRNKKKNNNCTHKTYIAKEKDWINYTNIEEEEEWMADSGATAHVTNTEKYTFNKIKDWSVIVVGTGKETKAIARGDVMIHHSKTGQLIKLKNVLLVPNFK